MEAIKKEELYTIDYIFSLPEGERAELIDGVIYDMTPPKRIHQRIVLSLSRIIADYIDRNDGDCEVYPAPFAVFLNKDNKTYVEPDISVICDRDKLTDQGCNGAPDWIIEIVSSGSRQMDYYKKMLKYRTAGVREYWVVDPEKKTVTVYDFVKDEMLEYTFTDKVKVNIYDNLEIDFSLINLE